MQAQLDQLVAEYAQLQEHTKTIENINKEGGKFIREAKVKFERLPIRQIIWRINLDWCDCDDLDLWFAPWSISWQCRHNKWPRGQTTHSKSCDAVEKRCTNYHRRIGGIESTFCRAFECDSGAKEYSGQFLICIIMCKYVIYIAVHISLNLTMNDLTWLL